MTATLSQLGIDRMTIAERIALVQVILDSVAADQAVEPIFSEAIMQELDRRVAHEDAHPGEGIPWEVVEAATLARLAR